MNKVILTGFTGNDPQVHTFANGDQKVSISLATSERWNDKNTGEPREKTEWHTIVFPPRSHNIVQQYLGKGRRIMVEGKISYNSYEKDGKRHTFTEIHCTNFEFLDNIHKNQNNATTANNQPNQNNNAPANLGEPNGYSENGLDDDQPPF